MTALGFFADHVQADAGLFDRVRAVCSVFTRLFCSNTRRLITEEITETVIAEIAGLYEQYRLGGI